MRTFCLCSTPCCARREMMMTTRAHVELNYSTPSAPFLLPSSSVSAFALLFPRLVFSPFSFSWHQVPKVGANSSRWARPGRSGTGFRCTSRWRVPPWSSLNFFPLSFRVRWRRFYFALLGEFFLLFLPGKYLFCFLLLRWDTFVARGEELLGGLLPFAV